MNKTISANVTSKTELFTVGGIEYAVTLIHNGPLTLAAIAWVQDGKVRGFQGAAACNPKDEYDQATGDKLAMKRACGVGIGCWACHMPELYSAWRKARRERITAGVANMIAALD